jgi:methylmalonyl-CoA mutase cobalamin-binding subunit
MQGALTSHLAQATTASLVHISILAGGHGEEVAGVLDSVHLAIVERNV